MSPMLPSLPPDVEALWVEYQDAEKDRIRGLTMDRLETFIDRLLAEPSNVWRPWALELAASVADRGSDLQVRFPLFRRVLLPALAKGVTSHEAGCARWLARFESLLYHSDQSALPEELRTAVALLREAVRLDADDALARRRLVERHASYLDYTLHELPDEVLYGQDGATPEQCDDLLGLLTEFEIHVEILGDQEKYAHLMDECRSHYNSYRDYLLAGRPYGSYEQFLAQRGA
jgi:hypothetical protein